MRFYVNKGLIWRKACLKNDNNAQVLGVKLRRLPKNAKCYKAIKMIFVIVYRSTRAKIPFLFKQNEKAHFKENMRFGLEMCYLNKRTMNNRLDTFSIFNYGFWSLILDYKGQIYIYISVEIQLRNTILALEHLGHFQRSKGNGNGSALINH